MRIVFDLGTEMLKSADSALVFALARGLAVPHRHGVEIRIMLRDGAPGADAIMTALRGCLRPDSVTAYPPAAAADPPIDLRALHLATLEPNLVAFVTSAEQPRRSWPRALPGIPAVSLTLLKDGAGIDLAVLPAGANQTDSTIHIAASGDVAQDCARVLETLERLVRAHAIQPAGIVRRPAPTRRIETVAREAARALPPGKVDAEPVADALIAAARPGTALGAPRLIVDTSTTAHRDAGTGIQRVVRRTMATLRESHAALPMDRVPVAAKLGLFDELIASDLENPRAGREAEVPLGVRGGDVLLLLDSSWGAIRRFDPAIDAIRAAGGMTVGVVYDLVPYLHPDLCDQAMPDVYDRWLRWLLRRADGIVCISQAVADELVARIPSHRIPHRDGLRIGWWHLGSDIAPAGAAEAANDAVRTVLETGEPPFLMVGTIEPRKRHAVVLAAFEALWAEGSEARLVLMGKSGWGMDAFVARLREHPERGHRLHWFEQASDADVTAGYARARALVFASIYEGYGLPIVEAARAGVPVIASDIPVLREVGGAGVAYFAVDDPVDLARVLRDASAGVPLPDPSRANILTWKQSVDDLLDVVLGEDWHVVLRM